MSYYAAMKIMYIDRLNNMGKRLQKNVKLKKI